MALFYIHIDNGTGRQIDDIGSAFANGRQAIGEAAKMAGEILRDGRARICDRSIQLIIENEDHRRLATIDMAISVADTNLR